MAMRLFIMVVVLPLDQAVPRVGGHLHVGRHDARALVYGNLISAFFSMLPTKYFRIHIYDIDGDGESDIGRLLLYDA